MRSALRSLGLIGSLLLGGCDTPTTQVVLDNAYPTGQVPPLVIFQGFWQSVSFTGPIPPGASSDPQDALPASANIAYVVLAPGLNPPADGGTSTPTSFIVLQSRNGFDLHLDQTLHIPVDDAHFVGNCATGSVLTQEQADFITQRVFANTFTNLIYDAATCTTTGGGR